MRGEMDCKIFYSGAEPPTHVLFRLPREVASAAWRRHWDEKVANLLGM